MIDLHSHVLPGIDDGPETIEGSVALARAAVAVGIRTLVATPHVSWEYDNDAQAIARLVDEVNTRLGSEGLALDVLPGAEIAMTRAHGMATQELSGLRLGTGPWLLIECPFTPTATGLDTALFELQARGHRILLAHPERCPVFHRSPGLLSSLVDAGMLTSVTAGALVGRFGGEVRDFADRLVHEGIVHNVCSDAHDDARRAPGIRAELASAGFGALEDWLARDVPAAILAGNEIPPRPSVVLPETQGGWRHHWRRHRRDSLRQA
jgi:protein-tyrosine phosphatase